MDAAEQATLNDYLRKRGLVDEFVVCSARLRVENGRMAGRVVIPWLDAKGEEIFKQGRSMNGQKPKYQNPTGVSRPALYASPGAYEATRVAVVEGTLNALFALQAGTAAFATAGQQFTEEAVAMLATKEVVILVPDMDDLGPGWLAKISADLFGHVKLLFAEPPEGLKDLGDVAERADDPGEAVAEVLYNTRQIEPKAYLPPKESYVVGRLEIGKENLSLASSSSLCEIVSGDSLALANTPLPATLPLLGVPGMVLDKAATMICSYPKVGKTTLMVAVVKEWLEAGKKILYVTEESRLVWEVRLSGGSWAGLDFIFALGQDHEAVFEKAFSGDYDILIVDTLRSIIDMEDETANTAIARDANVWIAKAREVGLTFIGLHHMTKAGGLHGRGIAGGHALLGCFDGAIEIDHDGPDNRRRMKTLARLISPPDMLYERQEDGSLKSLGNARALERGEVAKRALAILEGDGEWTNRKNLISQFDEPHPRMENLRLALDDLRASGQIERYPSGDKPGVTYRYRFLSNLPTTELSLGGRSGSDKQEAEILLLETFPNSEKEMP